MIKSKRKTDQCFSFGPVTYDNIFKKNILDTAKASQQSDVPTKTAKQNSDYFLGYFCGNINQYISDTNSNTDKNSGKLNITLITFGWASSKMGMAF